MAESANSATKKRKISHDDDDDEEEKMEKFYALIKSIREARDRLIIMNKEAADHHQSKTKKQKLEEVKQVVVWTPSFQREDFMEEADYPLKKPPVMSFASSSSSQSKDGTDNDQKEEVKEELDLSLSL